MLPKLTIHHMHMVEGLTVWTSKGKHGCVNAAVIVLSLMIVICHVCSFLFMLQLLNYCVPSVIIVLYLMSVMLMLVFLDCSL